MSTGNEVAGNPIHGASQEKPHPEKHTPPAWVVAAGTSYLGLFFGVAVVLGYVGGHYLDRRFHTAPWFMILGICLGIASGFKELYRLAKRHQRSLREPRQPEDKQGE